jgi:hypothetical protein
MTTTLSHWIRRCAASAVLAAAVGIAGCTSGHGSIAAIPAASAPVVTPSVTPGPRVVLRFGDQAVDATLTDTPASRQFAAMLPLTVQLKDVWQQAKSGRLPQTLTANGGTPVHDPTPGDIYFWPQTEVIVVYYADLGQAVPDPGLIRLGVIDNGLDTLTNAGRRVTIRIDLATTTSS